MTVHYDLYGELDEFLRLASQARKRCRIAETSPGRFGVISRKTP